MEGISPLLRTPNTINVVTASEGRFPILESLDTTAMQQLKQAHVEANQMQELLSEQYQSHPYTANPVQVHDQAIDTLHRNIWQQDTIYEDIAAAVRFLIERLQSDTVQDKDELLLLLAYVARGNSYTDMQAHLATDEQDRPECKEHLLQDSTWVQNAHNAVREGIEVYLDLLNHHEPAVRTCAAYTLACFREYARTIIPTLCSCIDTEEDQLAKSSLFLSLGTLAAYDSVCQKLLTEVIQGEASDLVKLAASIALARLAKNNTPPQAVRVLVNTLIEPESTAELYSELPWSAADIIGDTSNVLYTLGPHAAHIAIPILIEALTAATPHSSLRVVDALLHLAFNGERVYTDITAQILTDEQRLVLTTIANSDSAWVLNIINMAPQANL